MSLPALGIAEYNGYTFPSNVETTRCVINPEKDSAGRTVKGTRFSMTLRFLVQDNDGVDDTIATLQNILCVNGGLFKYQGHGLGTDFTINTGDTGDLSYGPWTKMRFKPAGGRLAAWVEFDIEFIITTCSNHPYGRIIEFCYSAEYSQGADRLTHRTIKGHYEIASRKISPHSNTAGDSADMRTYYEKVVPVCPIGWERSNERRELSENRLREDFSFTDQMMLEPRPPGCLEFSFDHSQTAAMPAGVRWEGTISARYKMALHAPRNLPYTFFWAAVRDRIAFLVQNLVLINKQGIPCLVPTSYTMTEHVHDRTSDFSLRYMFTTQLPMLMSHSMWRPLPYHDHVLWAQSMQLAYRPRGFSQDVFRTYDDVIVDLCANSPPAAPPGVPIKPVPPGGGTSTMIGGSCPDYRNSWLEYQLWVTIQEDDRVIEHRPLPTKVKTLKGTTTLPGLSLEKDNKPQDFGKDQGYTFPAENSIATGTEAPVVLQRQGKPVVYVWLSGRAVRVCHGIPQPYIRTVAGVDVIPANRPGHEYFRNRVVAALGLPVTIAEWHLRWILTEHPRGDIGPPNTPTAPPKPPGLGGATMIGTDRPIPGGPPIDLPDFPPSKP